MSVSTSTMSGAPSRSGVIVDFGLGNMAALRRKIAELDPNIEVSSAPEAIERARYLVLPGVGHFARAMENLDRAGLLPVLHKKVIEEQTPILGICVGMQLFARHSEEGDAVGLGWIDAEIKRIPTNGHRVPHIGWKHLLFNSADGILEGVAPDQRFYFIHSYHMVCNDGQDVLATAHYGRDLAAVVRRGHIVGTQFHPEKSHRLGMRIISNFLRMAAAGTGA